MKHLKTPLIAPVLGTQRVIDSFHFGTSSSGKKVYIQSSLHADELPGMLVTWKLKQQLRKLESMGLIHGEVVLVPVANPIGQNQHLMDIHLGRYELENGNNFNRGYYDTFDEVKQKIASQLTSDQETNKRIIRSAMKTSLNNWQVETEFQSQQKALQMLSYDADVMLDLHCDFEAILHIYSTHYSWNGIEPLASLLGSKINMLADNTGGEPFDSSVDMVWQRLYTIYGDVVPRGCIGATIELRGQADVSDEYAQPDCDAILQYLSDQGVIEGKFRSAPEYSSPSSDLNAVETLKATQSGLLVLKVQPGDWVEKGQLFAEVIDPINDQVEQIKVSQPGHVYSRTNRRTATAGMLVGNVAGQKAIRRGYLLAP